ncbi:MAG TPA: hypothetical protein PLL32_02360 [Anaeromyxobacteraceae bacterium]|nr:hypothetical protein [Anaeromyxobacteraceae bacterium]
MRTHQEIDARSLELHRLVAARIRRDPALLERVRLTLRRWRDPDDRSRADPYLAEWERLLDQGLEPLLATAVEDSERAATLRQCSPFTGILSAKERHAFLKSWAADHAT